MVTRFVLPCLLSICAAVSPLCDAAEEAVDYARDVKPVLKARCFACHGALKQQAKLRLDSGPAILQGGDSGPAVKPGDVRHSLLLERVSADESSRMPLEGKPLTAAQIATLKAWVGQGAKFPADDLPEPDPRQHWAFRTAVRPAVPPIPPSHVWPAANPVDVFLAVEQAKRGLTASPPADKATLLRRVHLDLLGLPPTRDQLNAFLADDSPEAYERVVNRLLESPQYGERWARHWMDVWRYSDWYGRRSVPDVMNSYPMIWRWRDWIVRSLNEDKGYDRMVAEMLAADEIAPDDDANLPATGFIVRNWFKWNYQTWMRDQVEHTAKAFLGLTLNCAHCHDHKYDPLTQREYFQFRAFFEPLELRHDRVPGEPDPGPFKKYVYALSYGPIASGMIRVFDEQLDAKTYLYVKGDERNRLAGQPPVEPGVPAALGGHLKIEPVALPLPAFYPGAKPFIQQEEMSRRQNALAAAETALGAARKTCNEQQATLDAGLASAQANLDEITRQAAERLKNSPPDAARSRVLAGLQSLLLDAATGRRTLGHRLAGLKGLDEQSNVAISFQVAIHQDQHFNFQLALDIDKGLTGAFVAFDKGLIRTYKPGTFEEIEAGRYDFAGGQNRFAVTLYRDGATGLARLQVTCLNDSRVLVDKLPSDPHGWLPVPDGKRGIFLDARPGTVVSLDDLLFTPPGGEPILRFDFESNRHADGQDVDGVDGWLATSFCVAPAMSKIVSSVSGDKAVAEAAAGLRVAERKRHAAKFAVAAAETKTAALRGEIADMAARVAADKARHGETPSSPTTSDLIRAAAKSELESRRLAARAALAAAEHAVAVAELPVAPTGDAAKDTQQAQQQKTALAKVQQQLSAARQALATAEAAPPPADYTPLSTVYPKTSTGRRRALAQWLAHRDNPLTARVAVNYLWGWHFGRPLVETTANLGRNGKPPSHPELLDWLAVELMDNGWRMKPLHRLILTSQAYRQASFSPLAAGETVRGEAERQNALVDPDNRWLWRFSLARMEAEVVRDSALHVAGELDGTLGGPELDHALGLISRRRSLYFSHHGESKMPFLELFDGANPNDCYQRTTSVAPQQALALTNSELIHGLGRALAAKLWSQVPPEQPSPEARDQAFITAAFEQVLSRPPTKQELAASQAFLQRQQSLPPDAAHPPDRSARARETFVQALFSHHDFITLR